MSYEEALEKLYEALPAFHRIGSAALKPSLQNTLTLLERLGNPHNTFKSIHIAGTNGKGSTSHSLASVLQEAGYKTGLYTSPHLKEYRERIRLNGEMIPKDRVTHFVEHEWPVISDGISPSFFEATVALCFQYFAECNLDIAVVETGLGGRLDSTNVITPILSLITNIGYDHQDILGPTLPLIASEKGGIIKQGIPTVVSQRHPETDPIFEQIAHLRCSPLIFAEDDWSVQWSEDFASCRNLKSEEAITFRPSLKGAYQAFNTKGILSSIAQLNILGLELPHKAVVSGLEKVSINTGFAGRWQILQEQPLIVADTAHNEHGLRQVLAQAINLAKAGTLTILIGFVGDKDLAKIYPLLPREAKYIFCEPDTFRRLSATELASKILENTDIEGTIIHNVNQALAKARSTQGHSDVILITGSTFLVGDLDAI